MLPNIKSFLARGRDHAPAVLRIGLSLVFLWFGISQLARPESFLGYVPQWLASYSGAMLVGNGLLDLLLGALLLLGIFTRIAALIGGLHLLSISLSLGYNDIAVRDMGLAMAAFSVFLSGEDSLCLGRRLRRR